MPSSPLSFLRFVAGSSAAQPRPLLKRTRTLPIAAAAGDDDSLMRTKPGRHLDKAHRKVLNNLSVILAMKSSQKMRRFALFGAACLAPPVACPAAMVGIGVRKKLEETGLRLPLETVSL
jgi:hypothetical protein